MKKFKLIVPSFVALIFCMLLIAGSTFALFTSEDHASVEVTSGKVEYEANLTKVKLSHVLPDPAGTILDENGETYSRVDGSFWYEDADATEVENAIVLERMVPGDKAEYTLTAKNNSNVDTKYRVTMAVEANSALASGMLVTIGELSEQGLVAYQTEWKQLTPGNSATYDLSFELPLESGNVFQESNVKYLFTVEAVQGNAATSGSENYETIDLYVEEAKSEAQEISATEATAVALEVQGVEVAPNENLKVNASIPAENTFKNADNEEMAVTSTSLKVSDLFVSSNNETNETTIAADVKLLDQDGKEIKSVDPEKPVTVNVYVGEGFNSVKVKHNGTLVEGSTYNPTTGYVTFSTASFSPFEFIGDFAALIGTKYYGTFEAAYEDANENNTVVLLKDVELNSVLEISKSFNLDGNGHKISAAGSAMTRAFNIQNNTTELSINLLNVNIDATGKERAISLYNNSATVNLTLNHCITTSDMYAINIAGSNSLVNLTVKNSSVSTGWCAAQTWSHSNIVFEDSELIGINNKTYNADGWNNFSTFVVNEQAVNSTILFKNCTIKANATTGNKQTFISIRVGTTMDLQNCKFVLDGENIDDLQEIINNFTFTSNDAIQTTNLTINEYTILEYTE